MNPSLPPNQDQPLPIVRELPAGFSIADVFFDFANRDGCLWFDSASSTPRDGGPLSDNEDSDLPSGRYSFLMSNPVDRLIAYLGDRDPWPQIAAWYDHMPKVNHSQNDLPPMQGGIAGLIGYEAATWLETIPIAREDNFPTPAIWLGLYDWTIATDHHQQKSWLISQGFAALDQDNSYQCRVPRAMRRADEVQQWLETACRRSKSVPKQPLPLDDVDRSRVESNFSSESFRNAIARVVEKIFNGDCFQVNVAQRLLCRATSDSADLYQRLRSINPAPFGAFLKGEDFEVISSSPESFLKLEDGWVETRPIKGTVARTGDEVSDRALANELSKSEKERAENIMIVDLMRNDLSRVCTDESVHVRKLCQLEKYQYVQHLVSVVEGKLDVGRTIVDLLKACFPGGSITGAPKIEAMRTIAELEPHCRGPYCGSMGYISCHGAAEFNILIRTITSATRAGTRSNAPSGDCETVKQSSPRYWQIPVGGGITARSRPELEEAETWIKAAGILKALPGGVPIR
ncbi:Aminodeoxychorismate synthase component 1 [Novipirellula aureliae]|uniref:Aminodeoxychorismate synthase component 1 n=1 Tax=Novipirellula aureliae TaxID=2527966 RepID=A0A5C6DLW0_9BACT|nr:anthranilate synthase component I family protein [Novipirellula aureliae]TWU37612.1 Aminodeoxychorismate synthase component 1 [Novipirellula aureliae]